MPRFFHLVAILAIPSSAFAVESVDFNRDIRPLLFANCIACHGPDEAERAAGLRLDTEAGATEDLGGYSAIVPGNAGASELVARITSEDDDVRMPPPEHGSGLSEQEVRLLKRWIADGGSYAKHWSYALPQSNGLPDVNDQDWPINGIDYFVLAKLESMGLRPSKSADRLTLARRVALDLTGLPPTWEEAQRFAQDRAPKAYERYVDAQLNKLTFGERWARVWLDLARYADSAGYADDPPRTIWAFRDYVIRSLNDNKPFDEFTIEQIAGDLLESPNDEQLVATAFHRNTLTNNEGGTNDEEFRNVAIVDRVNTTMAVWMGTTMACAQCHTHKYDPITQEEYFRFFALFNNTEDSDKRNENPTLELFTQQQKDRRAEIEKRLAQLREVLGRQTPELDSALEQWVGELGAEPKWDSLVPDNASSSDRELNVDDAGWIRALGEEPESADDVVEVQRREPGVITGLRIEVPERQTENFVVSQVSAEWIPHSAEKTQARFVRVTLPGKNKILHLAEIEVFSAGTNVATSGTARASSSDYGGPAKFVIDGNTDGEFSRKSVNHTKKETSPWVEIDLGSSVPVDRVVIWNRTDGGDGILKRLDGFRVELFSEDRDVVWGGSPSDRGMARYDFSVDRRKLQFVAAFADFEQDRFPASSVIADKLDPKRGWSIAPQTGKPHHLTLVLKEPLTVGAGKLKVTIQQRSTHTKHTLLHFGLATTSDERIARWGGLPAKIRSLVRSGPSNWSSDGRRDIETYYRSIAPSLAPQRNEVAQLEKEADRIKPTTTVPVLRERKDRRQTNIQIRGNYLSKGDEVTRGTPSVFHPLGGGEDPSRLDLAKWLVDERNPLTARVIANRHWEQLFGVGIVETSEEFGSQGELPSHPKLLDWLAIELQEGGWDIKQLIKLIVTSATYRQSSVASGDLIATDPFNRWLSRGPRFRVSAEMVRDQALFASGLLSKKMFGPPVKPMQPQLGLKAAFGSATDWQTSVGEDRYRRGIYTTWRRSSPYPSMAQFDAPNREVCTVRRIRTNTPLQALVTLNDPVYVEAAQALSRKLIANSQDPVKRIEHAFQRTLIRDPSDAEIDRLIALANMTARSFEGDHESARKMANDPLGGLDETADVIDHAAWTVVSNVILNLDEMLMKR